MPIIIIIIIIIIIMVCDFCNDALYQCAIYILILLCMCLTLLLIQSSVLQTIADEQAAQLNDKQQKQVHTFHCIRIN